MTDTPDHDAGAHKVRMQAVQRAQREKTREARDPERGLVLVHTGNGKGKSSSAFGVIARALGWGQRVGVVQFIKGSWKTGERAFFARFPDELVWHTMGEGFTWDTQDRDRDVAAATQALARAEAMITGGDFDLVVLDEINIALRYDYLDIARVLDVLDRRAARTGVILTGRDARPELMDYADLVSEMREVKHPFAAGIRAQRGIDF
ncbi:cob(I)yrinic acid a,c-diamide adenosyltransferase [Sphingomonas changnyeongensis]|uniref:Corrinoid adenosyltransferase n=1 Tax=Sphingomonas changnyeongensis TaxID=2698679 RepID=A0A7Z2S7X8_9SPHN|nr:cob(I)yrinic acid a,c-diamide adenosyltransferase [Sphingomonas changnyeongensis]QHL90796.1 cob(I)yrinic acid a,c-diamide adenosyltransferase [Sphingomonas changnyeongensis]